ncbi:MAG: site-2 protease family protein [Oscillospiraceae bacterium]
MRREEKKFDMSAGAVLLLAALWFICDVPTFAAIFLAASVHEAGHILALRAAGCRISGFRADAGGAMLLRRGALSAEGEVICAASGPIAGLVFAFLASAAGRYTAIPLLTTASGISLALSLFNLLPASPLDGGRILSALAGERAAAGVGLAVAVLLLSLGLVLTARGLGLGLFIAGMWLTLAQAGL